VGSGVVDVVVDPGEVVVGANTPMLHVPVKPLYATESSDVRVTLRKPARDE
jgi:hypothetical protein